MVNKLKSRTPLTDALHDKWESIYLDQGGCLTMIQRDRAFTEVMALASQLELQLRDSDD